MDDLVDDVWEKAKADMEGGGSAKKLVGIRACC